MSDAPAVGDVAELIERLLTECRARDTDPDYSKALTEDIREAVSRLAALQQRVEELEGAMELRWADIAHLDTKLADVLDRADAAEARERVLRSTLIEAHKALWVSGWQGHKLLDKIDAAISAHKEGGE